MLSPELPTLMDDQPCSWPNPFSVQVTTTDDVAALLAHEYQPVRQAQHARDLLAIQRKLVVAAWLVHASTGQLPAVGDDLHLPEVFGETGLRVTLVTRCWVQFGRNVMKVILTFDLASVQ